MIKVIGYMLVAFALFLIGFVVYKNSKYGQQSQPFSTYTVLTASWEKYKGTFINTDGRVVDINQGDITTSEGQSYALLRAVWVDDHEEFDKVWQWTQKTLHRPNDHLFGWRWGKHSDGTYGFMPNGGDNSASDADSDIALALLLASSRWDNKQYKSDAIPIIQDMWTIETATISGKRYLAAGNWATNSAELTINPSYFSPYAWRIFAKVDKHDDWNSLITPAYQLLEQTSRSSLGNENAIGLPPDWVSLDSQTLKPPTVTHATTNYSFDAMRIPWRVSVDYQWNNSKEAKSYLHTVCAALTSLYQNNGKLVSVYSHSGDALTNGESPGMYGASIGCLPVMTTATANMLYQQKIISLYSNSLSDFNPKLSYYDQNWLWFGFALHNNAIRNFSE